MARYTKYYANGTTTRVTLNDVVPWERTLLILQYIKHQNVQTPMDRFGTGPRHAVGNWPTFLL